MDIQFEFGDVLQSDEHTRHEPEPTVDEPFAGSDENIITYEDHAVHGIVEPVSVTLTPNANSG